MTEAKGDLRMVERGPEPSGNTCSMTMPDCPVKADSCGPGRYDVTWARTGNVTRNVCDTCVGYWRSHPEDGQIERVQLITDGRR